MASGKLSALKISKLRRPGSYADGGNLYAQISTSGGRAWVFRFMQNGRSRKMGMGSLDLVSLAEAREEALACRKLLRQGIDPIEARRSQRGAARAELARQLTFRECGEKFIAAHKAGWRNADHAAQWPASLAAYAYPRIGGLAVDQIETAHIMQVLEPLWADKTETASRVRGRIESILNWAAARGFRSGENPARWRGHLENLLPARRKIAAPAHHPALPFAEVPAFMAELRKLPGTEARALEFCILTAARSGEVLGARWAEIDFAAQTWTRPRERMKNHREHRVPLAPRAMQILEGLPRGDSEFVFGGRRAGKPLVRKALLLVLKRLRADCVPHGFRSSFRDWASEYTGYPSELAEISLAHAAGDKVEQAYRRGDQLAKRRRLMADWAAYCASPGPARAGDNGQPLLGALRA